MKSEPDRRPFWSAWIEPAASLSGAPRRDARLLAALLVVLIGLGAVTAALQVFMLPGFAASAAVIGTGLALLVGAYVVLRRGAYRPAAWLTVAVSALIPLVSMLANPQDVLAPAFLVVSVGLASVLLGARALWATAAGNVAGLILVATLAGRTVGGDWVVAPSFVVITAMLLWMSQRHRAALEHDRQATLAGSEERARRIFETSAAINGISRLRDGVFIDVNETFLRVLGLRREEVIGRSSLELGLWIDPDARHALVTRLHSERRVQDVEIALRTKSGERREGLAVAQLLVLDGEPCLFMTVQDITERKRAMERIESSQRELSAILRNMQDTYYRADLAGRVVRVSDSVRELLGYERQETIGRRMTEMFADPDGREEFLRALQAGGGALRNHEAALRRKDGSTVWVSTNAHFVRDEAGEIVGVEGTVRDISARRGMEQALRAREQQLRTVVNNAPVVLFAFDRNGVFTLSEGRGLDALGLKPGEVVGRAVFEVYRDTPDIVRDAQRALVGEAFAARTTTAGRVYEVHYTPVAGTDGAVEGVMGLAVDITEHTRAEDALRQSEHRLREVYQASPASISITRESDMTYLDVNAAFERITGWPRAEAIGRSDVDLGLWIDPMDRAALLQILATQDAVRDLQWEARTRSGGRRHLLGSIERVRLGDESCLLTVGQDITERVRTEAEMSKLSRALEQTADAIMITDAHGRIEYVNPAFERTTGFERREAIGSTPAVLKSGKHGAEFYSELWRTILHGDVFSEVFVNRRKDGSLFYEEKTITPLTDELGRITHFIASGKDISERMQVQERLQYLAHHDTLTELPNRALLLDRLKQALARARWHRRLVGVLFVDLDRFKVINDTLGHDAGDRLLQTLGERFRSAVRERDTVARLGGDEFAILLDEIASANDIAGVAKKVLAALAPPFVVEGRELFVTASIGVALYPDDGADSSTLLKHADIAMYRAKDLGRNNYQFYSSEMSAKAFERLTLESSLRRALTRGEFLLRYQPQIDVASRRVTGVEALLRWQHPELGLVVPNDFVPLLEETGLIVPVGEWVLRAAAQQACAWAAAGFGDLVVGVNISSRQFNTPGFPQLVQRILGETGACGANLEFEITESVVMHDSPESLARLEALNALGVRLAIDDFGTGYSSLSYLKRFPIDTLKIDGSFVRDVTHDPDDAAIVTAILAMAKGLKLRVVAEGVETTEQFEFLRARGCDAVQGFLINEALPAPVVTEELRDHAG
jgi:diguanylate cyclase (GGDEF)-like protein/PAS domain S-box-containing protein